MRHHFYLFASPDQSLQRNCRVVVLTDEQRNGNVVEARVYEIDEDPGNPLRSRVFTELTRFQPFWADHRALSADLPDPGRDARHAAIALTLALLATQRFADPEELEPHLDCLGAQGLSDLLVKGSLPLLFACESVRRRAAADGRFDSDEWTVEMHQRLTQRIGQALQHRLQGSSVEPLLRSARKLADEALGLDADDRDLLAEALAVASWGTCFESLSDLLEDWDRRPGLKAGQTTHRLRMLHAAVSELLPELLQSGVMARDAWLAMLPAMLCLLPNRGTWDLHRRLAAEVLLQPETQAMFTHSFALMLQLWADEEGVAPSAIDVHPFFTPAELQALPRLNRFYERLLS